MAETEDSVAIPVQEQAVARPAHASWLRRIAIGLAVLLGTILALLAIAYVWLDSSSGKRFIANTPDDAATLMDLQEKEGLGRRGRISRDGARNVFTPS